MTEVKFTDLCTRDEVLALGLPAPRLGLVLGGMVGLTSILNLGWPEPVRLCACALLAGFVGALAWVQVEGMPLSGWAWRAMSLWERRWQTAIGPQQGWCAIDSDRSRDRSGASVAEESA
ncbi:MAG: hypothetical protein ACYDC5_05865 [Candidatus Dormibacteria bacterium]